MLDREWHVAGALPENLQADIARMVPAEVRRDVYDGICRGLLQQGRLPLHISPLQGGMSARVFSLAGADNSWVLRIIPRRKCKKEFHREIFFSKLMSDLRVGPELFFADECTGIIIMQQLPDLPSGPGPCGLYSDDFLIRLAALINRLHSTVFQPHHGLEISMEDRLRGILARLPAPLPGRSAELCKKLAEFGPVMAPFRRHCLVHHDLNPRNILDDGGRLWFIDWELTGYGDLWYDIANVLIFFIDTSAQERLFLQECLSAEITETGRNMIFLNKILCLTFYGHALQIVAGGDLFRAFDQEFDSLPDLRQIYRRGERWAPFADGPAAISRFGKILLREAHKLSFSGACEEAEAALRKLPPKSPELPE